MDDRYTNSGGPLRSCLPRNSLTGGSRQQWPPRHDSMARLGEAEAEPGSRLANDLGAGGAHEDTLARTPEPQGRATTRRPPDTSATHHDMAERLAMRLCVSFSIYAHSSFPLSPG